MAKLKRIKRLKGALESTLEKSQDASKEALDKAMSATGQVLQDTAGKTVDIAASAAGQVQDAAEKTVNMAASAAGQVQDAAGKTVDIAASAAGQVQDAAGQAVDMAASAATGAVDQVKGAYEQSKDKIFPVCPVPAFMLPTGPSPEDYFLVFHLDEILDNLKSGVLVRPKIEVWAARESGHDLEHLAQEIEQNFVGQSMEARGSLLEAGELDIEELESEQSRLSDEMKSDFEPTLQSAAWWTFFMSHAIPWGPLLLLSFGLRPRTTMLGLLRDYMKVWAQKGRTQREVDREVKKLESKIRQEE